MRIEYMTYITRKIVQENRHKIFLFGDNDIRKGYGGQAKEMRGEPNALGIRTKHLPSTANNAFWSDENYTLNVAKIDQDFAQLDGVDKTIVIPTQGLGTGLSALQAKAPKTFEYLQKKLNSLKDD